MLGLLRGFSVHLNHVAAARDVGSEQKHEDSKITDGRPHLAGAKKENGMQNIETYAG
jgi:hypothetical protein